MTTIFGRFGPRHPRFGQAAVRILRPMFKRSAAKHLMFTPDSAYAKQKDAEFREKIARGETVYLVGLGPGTHNAGVALIACSKQEGIRLLNNHEEERFSGIKHGFRFPKFTIEVLKQQMKELGIGLEDIHAFLATFNFVEITGGGWVFEEAPQTLRAFLRKPPKKSQPQPAKPKEKKSGEQGGGGFGLKSLLHDTAARLGKAFDLDRPIPVIGMRHHDNHAYFSYAVSPFGQTDEKVMVAVIDGSGDDAAISLYVSENKQLRMLYANNSFFDSLGTFYAMISSTQGGWTALSSEGRYMGAAAWGNQDRMTNPYYRQLRQLLYFANDGKVLLNRELANWHIDERNEPYTEALKEILGEPIPRHEMWNPDRVLNVEDVKHAEITRERLDKAAATQMVFEDGLFHIISQLIRDTGSNKLVLTGGTALNCIANMRLLEHFDERFFERYLGKQDTRLHLWVPPTPGDAGVTMGAAYSFAMKNGITKSEPLKHAFYCGFAPTTSEIQAALSSVEEIQTLYLGNTREEERLEQVTDLLAYIISHDGICGLYQGAAETGPRALGHRSILANPTNLNTRGFLNERVKFRELVRPLAPMATYEAAHKWFELQEGASDDAYNAYNYMVLTARARQEAYERIPAVIHFDGTGRVQIVRPESDPFTHGYLKAMGRRTGVEVSVNTSLNVGGPIVQTPVQALETLKKSKGMHGLVLVGAEGDVFLAWHHVDVAPKDAGRTLNQWVHDWQQETGVQLVDVKHSNEEMVLA